MVRAARRPKKVVVVDTDASHYPYSDELLIGGMSCDGCAQNVANALNALDGVWATVTYADHTARVRSKQPVDRCSRDGRERRGLLRHDAVSAALDALPWLGLVRAVRCLGCRRSMAMSLSLRSLKAGERLVEDAGAGAMAVRIVIGDTNQVATFETLELFRKYEGFFLP